MTDSDIQTFSKRTRMVYSTSHSRFLLFSNGQSGMEIAVLLLLTVPVIAASPLRLTPRSDADIVLSGAPVQSTGVEKSEDTQEQHASLVKIVPFHSEDKRLDLEAVKHRNKDIQSLLMAVKLRSRRAPQRGCQLGTCQVHNLASTLYNISKTSGKEESKGAKDPQGFGR